MDNLHNLVAQAATIPPSAWCQAFFIGSSAAAIGIQLLPSDARSYLLDYGARSNKNGTAGGGSKPQGRDKTQDTDKGLLAKTLAQFTSYLQVPHAWFWHYYFLSVSLSALWAWQYLSKGSAMALFAHKEIQLAGRVGESDIPKTELGRVFLAWCMMALQGSRRLFECFAVVKPGRSPMLALHWVLGLGFYTAMSVAVWIEGSDAILRSWKTSTTAILLTPRVPSTLAVFFAAWIKQNECHRHLASLKKYTLPSDGMFKYIVCPHYTCECAIYLAISFMAAPSGTLFNRTVLCGLVFVVVNLGVTAHGTKHWYASKFGAEKVEPKWKMIPLVF